MTTLYSKKFLILIRTCNKDLDATIIFDMLQKNGFKDSDVNIFPNSIYQYFIRLVHEEKLYKLKLIE